MNKIVKRILIGALAVTIPVGGSIFYFATKNNESKNNTEEKENKDNKDKDKDKDKKDDDVDHPKTDAKISNPHKERIELLRTNYNNQEIVGYLDVPNTSISTVVVQHEDNDYYLNHGLNGDEKVDGTVYLDYRVEINSGRKNIIYGHNGDSEILNVPFYELENYYNKEYFNEHQYIYLEDEDGVGTYQVFSVYVEVNDLNYMYLNFKTDSAWLEHLTYLKNKSLYDTLVDVDETDEILVLQTCSHNELYSKYKNKYLLVIAKRVKYE